MLIPIEDCKRLMHDQYCMGRMDTFYIIEKTFVELLENIETIDIHDIIEIVSNLKDHCAVLDLIRTSEKKPTGG